MQQTNEDTVRRHTSGSSGYRTLDSAGDISETGQRSPMNPFLEEIESCVNSKEEEDKLSPRVTSTPARDDINHKMSASGDRGAHDAAHSPIPDGSFCGQCRHKDGSFIGKLVFLS